MILSNQSSTSVEDATKARGAPIWFQLYATNNYDIAAHHVRRAERAGCVAVAVTVDRSGGRNTETERRLQRTDTRNAANVTTARALPPTSRNGRPTRVSI